MFAHLIDEYWLKAINLSLPTDTPAKSQPTHWVPIIDRSGSMHWTLYQLGEDLINLISDLPDGDTVSFGWFSSPGEFRFITRGYGLNGKTSRDGLARVIRQNVASLGSTCFSGILVDAKQLVAELKPLGGNFGLMFLTDGHPVVPDIETEKRRTLDALEALGAELSAALVIGYGDYYNKPLMAAMTERVGGSLIHASDLPYLATALQAFVRHAPRGNKRQPFQVGQLLQNESLFLLTKNELISYVPSDHGEIYLPSEGGDLYQLVTMTSHPEEEVPLDRMQSAAYAAATIFCQRGRDDVALEILIKLGDTRLIQQLTNAFTVAEYGAAEGLITAAALNPRNRFEHGKVVGFQADPNTPSVLDVLLRLGEDEDAFFYPYHQSFKYKRIGRPSVVVGNPPEFNPDRSSRSALSDLVWNKTRLNLSLRARVSGHVDLNPDDAATYGLPAKFQSFIWRNYSIIAGGLLNTPVLPVSVSQSTFKWLKSIHLIEDDRFWGPGTIYSLILSRLPLINRTSVTSSTSAKALAELVWAEMQFEASQKYFNAEIKRLDPEGVTKPSPYSALQQAFLHANGINADGAYDPDTTKEAATDVLRVPEFDIKLTGFSSLPPVEKVKEALTKGKTLTPSQQLVADNIQFFESHLPSEAVARLEMLRKHLAETRRELRSVRGAIAARKLGLVLGRRWFTEFTSRSENVLELGGREYTFAQRWVEEEI